MRGPLPTRLIVRSVTGFVLRVVRILMPLHDGDVSELCTFVAIRSASRAAGDTAAWEAQGPLRTVSVSAVARSLGLPVETVRRRVLCLIEKGYVVRAGRGVCAAPAHEASPALQAALHALAVELDATLASLAHDGLDLVALAGPPSGNGRPPAGAAGRPSDVVIGGIATAFCLRGLEGFGGLFGDLTRGLVWCAFLHENTKALHASPELSWAYGHQDTPPPDALRTPVSVREVAAAYFVPYETARRHAHALMETDAMERVDGRGLIVPARALTSDRLSAANPAVLAAFLQMLSALARAGLPLPPVLAEVTP